jgi:hypothetical protein
VLATDCHSLLNVEWYATMLSALAQTKSHAAVTSHVATTAARRGRGLEVPEGCDEGEGEGELIRLM